MSWFKEALSFTRLEFLGLLGLVSIGMAGILIQYMPEQKDQLYDLRLSDIMVNEEIPTIVEPRVPKNKIPTSLPKKVNTSKNFKKTKAPARQIFDFDPNTVSKESLIKLGFKNYLAERWVKFRSAGKKYQNVDDVLSIYGIDTNLVYLLKNHFQFPGLDFEDLDYQKDNVVSKTIAPTEEKAKTYSVEIKKNIQLLDLNLCTSDDLIKIKGIGSIYASRIIKYRSILGGFSNKEQLLDVYGMTDSTFMSIQDQVAVLSPPEQIRINTASQQKMAEHFLLSYKMSKLIYAYREEHGPFVDKNDFKEIKGIEPEKIEKIIPYLDFAL